MKIKSEEISMNIYMSARGPRQKAPIMMPTNVSVATNGCFHSFSQRKSNWKKLFVFSFNEFIFSPDIFQSIRYLISSN